MRKFNIKVNGKEYEVEVEEIRENSSNSERKVSSTKIESIVKPEKSEKNIELKKDLTISAGEELIEAPMPGTILSINVSTGDEVKEGDILMILEAMKMENEILASKDGVVKALGVSEGNIVETGDKLIILQ